MFQASPNPGIVYALVNEAMPDLVKIGLTRGDWRQRVKELDVTGVTLPFNVHHASLLTSVAQAERLNRIGTLHRLASNKWAQGRAAWPESSWVAPCPLLNVAKRNSLRLAVPPCGTAARMLRKVQVFKHMRRQFLLDEGRGSSLQPRSFVADMLVNVGVEMIINDKVKPLGLTGLKGFAPLNKVFSIVRGEGCFGVGV